MRILNQRMLRLSFLVAAGWCVAKCFAEQNVMTVANSAEASVDQLIPWLLDEDRQLRGIAFSEVILDTTGKHVLAVDRKNGTDERVIKQISTALDETMRRMNASDSPIQKVTRINEVSSQVEDLLGELLNATRGLSSIFLGLPGTKFSAPVILTFGLSILRPRVSFISIQNFMPLAVATAVFAPSISNRKSRRTRFAMTPFI